MMIIMMIIIIVIIIIIIIIIIGHIYTDERLIEDSECFEMVI